LNFQRRTAKHPADPSPPELSIAEEPHVTPTPAARTGGQILVDQLIVQGVERVYCVPGESYLAALDALYGSGVEVTVCRQ
jgi:acetolactate synthase-1/2/3 large subunit